MTQCAFAFVWFVLCVKLYLQAKDEFLSEAHESCGNYTGEDEQATVDVHRHESCSHVHWSCRYQIDGDAHNYLIHEREEHITPQRALTT